MNTIRVRAAAIVLALSLTLGIAASQPAIAGAADLEQMIQSAKTSADHDAIAAVYDEQAKQAREKAEEHRKMGEAYKKGGGALAGKTHFYEHCEALTRSYTSEAKEYAALAAAHRQMAAQAKK